MYKLHIFRLFILFLGKIFSGDIKYGLKHLKPDYELPPLTDEIPGENYVQSEIDRRRQIKALIKQMGVEINSLFWGYVHKKNLIEIEIKTKRVQAELAFVGPYKIIKEQERIRRGQTTTKDVEEFENLHWQYQFELYKIGEEEKEKLAKIERNYHTQAILLANKFKTLHDLIDERTLGFALKSFQKPVEFYYQDILSENDETRRFYGKIPDYENILKLIRELETYAPLYSTYDPEADQPEMHHFYHAALDVATECVTNDVPDPKKLDVFYCGLLRFTPQNSKLCQLYRSLFAFLSIPEMISIIEKTN